MSKPTFQQAVENVDKWIRIYNSKGQTFDAASEEDATIEIDGAIGDDWFGEGENTTKAIRGKLKEIAKLKAKKITVNINSLGGQVNHGIGIHDVLAAHKAEIETNVLGMTASAATIIAQAGDTRRMSSNALYLIHQPWSIFISNVNEMEDALESMRKINDVLVRIYTKRSGQPESKIRELMDEANGNGKWIDADEAKEMGLIDEVYEPMKAAASIKDQITNLVNGPDELLNKLPEIPNSKIEMKNVTENTVSSEAAMTVTDDEKKGLAAMIATARKFFGVEEAPAEAEEEAEEETTAEVEEETTAETEEEVEEESETTAPQASAIAQLNDRMKQIEEENKALKSSLAKATASSTKIDGPEGAEGSGAVKSPEQEQLDADLVKLRATWNGEE